MTKQEKANQKRLDNATKASSMTLKAQLNAVNTDAGYKLKSTDKDGKVTEYAITKREHLEQNLGMKPHMSKKGVCLGYTPATFDVAVVPELKEVGTDGKITANGKEVKKILIDGKVVRKVRGGNDKWGQSEVALVLDGKEAAEHTLEIRVTEEGKKFTVTAISLQ